MEPTRVIDSDGHVFEPADLWQRELPEHLRDRGPVVQPDPEFMVLDGIELPVRDRYTDRVDMNKTAEVLRGDRFSAAVAADFSAASTLDSMDVEGIAVSVLFPSRALFVMAADEKTPAELTTACARVYNDFVTDYCSQGAGRLFAVAVVDPRDVDAAATEAQRAVGELGCVGVFLRPNPVRGRAWHSPEYDRLWAAVEELDVPVCFHEAGAVTLPQVATDRFDKHGFWHCATHPFENQLAMLSLVLGGVCERFPRLRFGHMECGAGWLPYWMWRMDEHYENEREWVFHDLTMLPSEYVKRQCFVAIDSDEEPGMNTIELLGGEHVVWGSDYPHADGKFPMAYKTLRDLPGIEPHLDKVVHSNTLELYGPRLRSAIGD